MLGCLEVFYQTGLSAPPRRRLLKFGEQYPNFRRSLLSYPVLLSIIWYEFCFRKVDAPLHKLWIAIFVQAYPGSEEGELKAIYQLIQHADNGRTGTLSLFEILEVAPVAASVIRDLFLHLISGRSLLSATKLPSLLRGLIR
jgi:hypothetical protein